MERLDPHRVIRGEVVVESELEEVWKTWTTAQGLMTFFAPDCRIDLRVDGAFEILFNPDAEPGSRGAEGTRIMAFQPNSMLGFTWSAPPHLPEVRNQWTHVVVRFESLEGGRTKVSLSHDGWGQGGQWDLAYDYFVRAWKEVVLPRLRYRFSEGPVDWSKPPM